jgi:hypothetical protein
MPSASHGQYRRRPGREQAGGARPPLLGSSGQSIVTGRGKTMKQMLIYNEVVPVTRERHGKLSLKPTTSFEFAGETNSVPLLAQEFGMAGLHFPIVFSEGGDGHVPAAILGVRDKENAFVAKDGSWSAPYIPAFLRRYPFIFATDEKAETFTLMVDRTYPGLNSGGKGERLFDADGEQTQFLKNAINFLSEYQAHYERTRAFGNSLNELGLLEPGEIHLPLPGDPERRLRGFKIVSRDKLRALSAETLARLNASGELELIYLHLFSLGNLPRLQEKLAAAAAPA